MIRILFVCLGNICRSAAAEAIMKSIVAEHHADDQFFIDSAGILNYHEGDMADPRMRKYASERGYNVTSISRPVRISDYDDFDLIIGMDDSNVESLIDNAMTLQQKNKIHQMSEYLEKYDDDYIPDPYYGGLSGFERVIDLLEDSCEVLFNQLNKRIDA